MEKNKWTWDEFGVGDIYDFDIHKYDLDNLSIYTTYNARRYLSVGFDEILSAILQKINIDDIFRIKCINNSTNITAIIELTNKEKLVYNLKSNDFFDFVKSKEILFFYFPAHKYITECKNNKISLNERFLSCSADDRFYE